MDVYWTPVPRSNLKNMARSKGFWFTVARVLEGSMSCGHGTMQKGKNPDLPRCFDLAEGFACVCPYRGEKRQGERDGERGRDAEREREREGEREREREEREPKGEENLTVCKPARRWFANFFRVFSLFCLVGLRMCTSKFRGRGKPPLDSLGI
jgi:hypothetical protein